MLTITAIIRAKRGHERTMRQALLEFAEGVRANEPRTLGYFVSQDVADPCRFTTYERFADKEAMDLHNNSDALVRFLAIAKPMLDGEVVVHSCGEIFAKV